MRRHLIALPAAVVVLLLPAAGKSPISASVAKPMLKTMEPAEMCLMPPRARSGYSQAATPARRSAQGGAGLTGGAPPGWPGKDTLGGNVPPARVVYDPHPTFNGMAIDPANNVVVFSDENQEGLITYALTAGGQGASTTEPRTHILGAKVDLGFIAGVTVDPTRREMYTVNNDGGGLVVHSYDSHGDVAPLRKLTVPHQSWGLSLDVKNDELAVTSQQYQGITIYRRTATGTDRPLRTIRGEKTMLADPHGVFLDPDTRDVFASNHGNWTEMRTYSADGPPLLVGEYVPGRFEKPSIRVYDGSKNGDVPPIRSIQGAQTRLAWPMGLTVDAEAGELAVANYGTNEVLIYNKGANGDVAPSRILGGDRTGIVGPIAVQIDRKNNEIWVANYGEHTAVVFDREASGNVAPKRIIRNAPAGTPTTGFTNASAAAYDSKRDQLLVPN
jgi:6-phosphogluconolactonase (cycloisomerase 2 family)